MADLKISQLTGATTPVAGSEVIPVVQSGSTKKVSIDNLTAGKSVPMSQANISAAAGGGFTTPALIADDGTGALRLVFLAGAYANVPAEKPWLHSYQDIYIGSDAGVSVNLMSGGTNALQADGNGIKIKGGVSYLDDYEEGTWTPVIYGWSGSYTTQTGRYTKIGSYVYLQAHIVTTGGTGTFTQTYPNIQGLPFSIANIGGNASYGEWIGASGFSVGAGYVSSGPFDYGSATEFFCNLTGIDTSGVGNLTNTLMSNSTNLSMKINAWYTV